MEQLEKYNNILERTNKDCLKLLEEDDIDNDFPLKNILYMTEKKITAEIVLQTEHDSYPLLETKVATTLYSFELVKKFIAGHKDI